MTEYGRKRHTTTLALWFIRFAAAAVLAISGRASAEEMSPWSVDGMAELGIVPVRPPGSRDGARESVVDVGFGASGHFALSRWFRIGLGSRFSTPLRTQTWGRYYSLSIPVLALLRIPLDSRGQSLELGGGVGGGGVWQRAEEDTTEGEPSRMGRAAFTWEAYIGHVDSLGPNGIALLLQAGVRREYVEHESMDLIHLLLFRTGIRFR